MHLLCSHTQLNDLSHFILCTYRVVEESMNILDLYRFLSSLPLKWFKVLSRECMSIMFNDLRKKIVFEEKKLSWLYVEACKHEIIRSIYVFFPQHWVSKAILITKYWFSAQIFFYFSDPQPLSDDSWKIIYLINFLTFLLLKSVACINNIGWVVRAEIFCVK